MSTAIPQSMTFEMLSRLPPNSFVLEWQEVFSSNPKPEPNGWNLEGGSTDINYNLRGAPNEFILNTHMSLTGCAWTSIRQSEENNAAAKRIASRTQLNGIYAQASSLVNKLGNALAAPGGGTAEAVNTYTDRPFGGLGSPYMFFNGSRESFNSGSLPYLDNQDTERSKDINTFRLCCAARGMSGNNKSTLETCCAPWSFPLPSCGKQSGYNWMKSVGIYAGFAADGQYQYFRGKNLNFQIPLGLYSSLINCHSVIPIGLFSSYAVDGYRIALKLNNQTREVNRNATINGSVWPVTNSFVGQKYWMPPNNSEYRVAGALQVNDQQSTLAFSFDPNVTYMNDLVIRYPIVRVLDPAVEEAVLSLYEKRETVNLGGVQFPLSLRLNSIGYRFYSTGIGDATSDYYFRIPTTDRSVRAVGWIVQNASLRNVGQMNNKLNLNLARLSTKIGTETIHPIVEDLTPNSENVNNFLATNIKRSASLFSPFPQYQEGVQFGDNSYDDLCRNLNAKAIGNFCTDADYSSGPGNYIVSASHGDLGVGVCMGIVSFENLDRREGDHSGSYQASGKDCTNVGSIEMQMRFGKWNTLINDTGGALPVQSQAEIDAKIGFGPPGAPFDITFIVAYDNVMEISPQGVRDITNAVL